MRIVKIILIILTLKNKFNDDNPSATPITHSYNNAKCCPAGWGRRPAPYSLITPADQAALACPVNTHFPPIGLSDISINIFFFICFAGDGLTLPWHAPESFMEPEFLHE